MTFPDEPLDVQTELQIGGVWTGVTEYAYVRDLIDIGYGRADEGTRVDPGKCQLTLNNRDGRFSNRNPLSPLFGSIGRNTPLRVSVPGPTYLASTADANGASTPDADVLDITGDLDVRIEATVDWSSGIHALLGKWERTGDQRSWYMYCDTGQLALSWSTEGTDATSFTAFVSLPGVPARSALRANLDVDTEEITFYFAESIAGPWTQIGDPVIGGVPTSIYAGTAPLAIGHPSGTVLPLDGHVHAVQVRDGIDGTVVADLDFSGQTVGDTSITDDAGLVWTLTGAAISDRWPRFTGEISSWPQHWDTSGQDVWTTVTASGILRRLGQGAKALDSTLRRRIPSADGLLAYWPMEEDAAATQAFSPVPGVAPLQLTGVDWAANDELGGSSPLPTLRDPAAMSARVPRASTAGWQIEMVYLLPTLSATETEILRVTVAGATMRTVVLAASTAGIRITALDGDSTVLESALYSNADALADFVGVWNRITIFTGDAGSGTTQLQATWRDVSTNVRSYVGTDPVDSGQGTVVSVTGTWGAGTEGMSIGHLSVFDTPGDGVFGHVPTTNIFEGADDGFAGETALDRINRVTTEESLTHLAVDGDFTTGSTQMGAQKPATLVEILQDCADADRGILSEDRTRLGLRYRDRATLYNQAPALTLDYTAQGEIGPPLEPVDDDQAIRNDVTVTRRGGSSARVVAEDGPLSVLAPPDGVGTYDESVTLNLAADDQTAQQAAWSVHLGTWDEARYPTVRVMLHAAPHLIPDVLQLELGDVIRITNLPSWLPPGPVDLMVQGVTETIGVYTWDITYNCTPASPWTIGVVEDEVVSRADTAGSELADDATSTATTLSVATTDGPVWTADLTDLPMNIRVGGEVMTVTSITGDQGDRFERSVTSGWGTATSGQTWSTSGGSASDFSVQGG